MKNFQLILLLLMSHFTEAQQYVEIIPVFESQIIKPGEYFYDKINQDSIMIESIKFYVTTVPHSSKESDYHLMIWEEENQKMMLPLIKKHGESMVVIQLGIDSIMNTSGALGGCLDPSIGMYWTWNTGYINIKLEGKSKNSTALFHEFQFHLGGYSGENNALREFSFFTDQDTEPIILLEFSKFFGETNLMTKPQVMSPSKEGNRLATAFVNSFEMKK